MKPAVPFLAHILVLAPVVPALAAQVPAEPAGEVEIAPVSVERIAPCCEGAAVVLDRSGPPAEAQIGPPEELYLPDREAIKARARWDPLVPEGRILAAGPPGGGTGPQAQPPARAALATRFDGLDFLQASGSYPPDTILGSGETMLLEATNGAVRLSGRGPGGELVAGIRNFFQQENPFASVFDPKVHYDPLARRFFAVAVSANFAAADQASVHLAVSRNAAPQGFGEEDWCLYQVEAHRLGTWADYPGLGVNERWLAVTVNSFPWVGEGYGGAWIYALDKRQLIANQVACPEATLRVFRQPNYFTIQPAQHLSASTEAGDPLYLVSSEFAAGTAYTFWRLSGDETVVRLRRSEVEGDFFYSWAPDAPQVGGQDFAVPDARIVHAIFRDGQVWAVHATACRLGGPPNEACIRVLSFRPKRSGADLAFQETYGRPGWYLWWPGVAVNGAGDLLVVAQRSRASGFLDAALFARPAGAKDFGSIQPLRVGTCPLDNPDGEGHNRSGDYVGAQADPADPRAFWIAGEYAKDLVGFGCNWGTHIAQVVVGPGASPASGGAAAPPAPPEAATEAPKAESAPPPPAVPLPGPGKEEFAGRDAPPVR